MVNDDIYKKEYSRKRDFSPVNYDEAKKIGIKEAFWLSHMDSWNRHIDDLDEMGKLIRKDPDWFYFQQERLKNKSGMSIFTQNKITNKLQKIGIIDKQLRGNPAKNWYRINYKKLTEFMSEEFSVSKKLTYLDSKKLTDSINNKIDNNKIKESTPALFSKPKIPADWKSPDYNKKIKYLLETNPKLNRLHLRFVLNHQEAQIENLPMSFKPFTDKQLINQIVNGTKVITRLEKTGLSFENLIRPVIEWGRDKSDFWPSKLISLVEIRNISKTNGQMKIMNVHRDWVKAIGIDPKVGRYLDEKDFKITTGFEKWDAKTPEEKRKAQDEFVPRRRPPLPPDFKHPENFKPEEIPQFMKDIFNNNQRN